MGGGREQGGAAIYVGGIRTSIKSLKVKLNTGLGKVKGRTKA